MKILETLREESERVNAHDIAAIYALLGEKDQAFDWLERGYQARNLGAWLRVEPNLDSLRSDPRFQDLLRRMNLEP